MRTIDLPRILVVDDSATLRAMACDAIEEMGAEAIEARDGAQALELVETRVPHLALIDVEMPGLNGFDVCRRLREDPRTERLPIVMLTGRDDLGSIQTAYEAGATDFAIKPVQWTILTHRIRYMLRASHAFRDLSHARERLAEAQRVARLGHFEIDSRSQRLRCSEEMARLLGLEIERPEVDLASLLAMVHPEERAAVAEDLAGCLAGTGSMRRDFRLRRPSGREIFVHMETGAVAPETAGPLEHETPGEARGILQDISDRKRIEREVRFLAYHDSLTRLGNRRLFREHLDVALARVRRQTTTLAVIYVDLDHFKRINDLLGHAAGDDLLQQISELLRESVRESDVLARPVPLPAHRVDPSLSRLGGDEFVILLQDVEGRDGVERVVERIYDALGVPIQIAGHEIFVSASLGIAMAPDDGIDADALVRRADSAMYHAKRAGRNNHQFFREELEADQIHDLALEADLRRALEEGALEVHYQPRIDVRTEEAVGFEALARWHHPERGWISPVQFIPLAETSGLIVELGDVVLREACRQAQAWIEAGFPPFRMSVNLSPQQFLGRTVVESVERALEASSLPPGVLELEITESTLMDNQRTTVEALEEMKGIGIAVSIDDFGTGYSSLGYLKRFPVDTLKIDRSFVRDLPGDADDAAITSAIISMAHTLELRVVAEGVETEAQRAFLGERGCDEIQGYLFGAAVAPDEILEAFRKR